MKTKQVKKDIIFPNSSYKDQEKIMVMLLEF